jgi:uncharacterized linocin/CFP29 family protein
MDLLKRKLAPILPDAWKFIDEEAARVLSLNLAGRKVVDFDGPHGFTYAAVNTGRMTMLGTLGDIGPSAGLREVQPLVELRSAMKLDSMELDTVARGGEDPDLASVVTAAEGMARAEDDAIFNGLAAADIEGIIPSSPHAPVVITSALGYAAAIVDAKELLRRAGIGGPYALVLGPRLYDEISAAADDGYPTRRRLGELVEGPIVWAPSLDRGVLISMRGGDYRLTVGQDLSVGYAYHEKHEIELFLTESFTFRVLEGAAAVVLERT